LIYNIEKEIKYKYGIIPHYIDKNHSIIKNISQNILYIDIDTGDMPLYLLNQILQCEIIISSSLHGLIIAVAYKKPCIWIKLSNNVIGDTYKFYDFFLSINFDPIEYKLDLSNKESLDITILEKYIINIDTAQVYNRGLDLINTLPYCTDERKKTLLNEWDKYIKTKT